jgi:golgin subfamily B member 1
VANSPAHIGAVDARAAGKRDGSNEKLKLSDRLASLQDDPEDDDSYAALRTLAKKRDSARLGAEPWKAVQSARQFHEARGELWAVAQLTEIEALLLGDEPAAAAAALKELGRLRCDELLDPEGGRAAYQAALELQPDDRELGDALRRLDQTEKSWRKFAKRFVEEARGASDIGLRTTLLLRAASLVFEYKKRQDEEAYELFREALGSDPSHRRAVLLYEQALRQRKRWAELAELLLEAAPHARDRRDSIQFHTRAGRLFARQLGDPARAADCYEYVLAAEPGHAEAIAFLSKHLTKEGRWGDLAALYDRALSSRQELEPPREQHLLIQAGMVQWRMRDDAAAAEPYFARLRKLDPGHRSALDFYREYYAGAERAEAWHAVLADAYRVENRDPQKLELALEMAQTAQAQPHLRDRAIEAWKLVQRLDPDNRRALQELKPLYARAQKWNALADVIKAEIEATPETSDERVTLLRELLAVYRDRLHMDGMVIGTLNRIVKRRPDDRQALEELTLKYESAGRYNDLINMLSEQAESLRDRGLQVGAYLRVARLWIERFSNYSQATAPLEKVLELEPENHEALELLKNIYTKKRAWRQLYDVLQREKSAALDPGVRLANTIEMAQLAADRLQSYGEAIALYQEAVALDPKAPGALEALEKLAESEGDHTTLVQIRELELRHAENDDARLRVLQKLALLYGERLQKPDEAVRCWRAILGLDPRHGRATRAVRDSLLKAGDFDGLEQLYVGVGDFEGLVDVFSHEADRTTDLELKIGLSFRAARIFEDAIGDPGRALRSYERVLSADPENVQAAGKLALIFEADAKWSRLRNVLEVMLRNEREPEQRLLLLEKLRWLCLGHLRDGEAAFGYAAQAYATFPERDALREMLETAAEAAVAFERLIEIFLARAEAAPAAEALLLRRRVAQIAQTRLGQDAVAAPQLRKILEAVPADVSVMDALERIYRTERRTDDLWDILNHRVQHEQDDRQRTKALKELAHLAESVRSEPEVAAAHYRALHELAPRDREVLLARDRLALAAERWEELAEVLDRRMQIEEDPGARVELAIRSGLLAADRLQRPAQALDAFEAVIEHHVLPGAAIEAIDRIADQQPELLARASELLGQVYQRSGRFDKLRKALLRRLKAEKDEETIRRLRLQVAEISSVNLGDLEAAYSSLETAFLDQPDDRELWERIAELAQRAGQQHALATAFATAVEAGELADHDRLELALRTARLYEQELEQPEDAEPFHRHVLRLEPLHETSFAALKQLYTGAERWEELQQLYRKRIEDTVDDADRLELQLGLCFLYEEVLDRPTEAIGSYQRVLELRPDHAQSRRMLERLYQQTERWRDLAELLRGNLVSATGPERVETMWQLGQLHENRLSEPGAAVEQYEAVLALQPHHLRAQQALAGLLGVTDQRQRIAAFLEPLYQAQGAYLDLCRVLEIQLDDRQDDRAAAELLLRIGELHEQRTRDLDAAFSGYARAVEREPDNQLARQALARLSSNREAFRRERAVVLQRALDRAGDAPLLQVELLFELAVLQGDFLAEKDAAERAYERVIELEPENADVVLRASRALEAIHTARQDHARVVIDLERQLLFESDPDLREDLLVRLAELGEHTLGTPDLAISAHRGRLERDGTNLDALVALERLYERTERYDELCEVLGTHQELSTDDSERRALGRRAAGLREDRLQDRDGAIAAYNDLIADLGPDRQTLRALAAAYERAERYPELLETLRSEAAFIDEPLERAEHEFRMAELMRLQTGELPLALELYDGVLSVIPDHPGSLAAIGSVMNDPGSDLRAAAARMLSPRYRASGSYQLLISALEVLQDTDVLADKLSALQYAAQVTEQYLHENALAFGYIARATRAAVDDALLPTLLRELDRLAESSGQFGEYVSLLAEIAPLCGDGELRAAIHRGAGRIARTRLQDARLALEHYTKLLEDAPDDEEAFDALQTISEEAGDYSALCAVLERKAEVATDRRVQAELRSRVAELYEQRLRQPGRAIDILQDLSIDRPSTETFASLGRLLRAERRWDELRALHDRQLSLHMGNAVELRYALAEICLHHAADSHAALMHLRDALTDDSEHEPSIALLEKMMAEDAEQRSAAAEALEPIYLGRMQWPKLTASLEARIQGESDFEERKRLLTRLGQIHEDQLEDYAGALLAYARLFSEDPRDEDTWETLSRLARMAGQWQQLGDILAKPVDDSDVLDEPLARLASYAGKVFADRIGDHARAAVLFEKALRFEPGDEQVFAALELAYRKTDNHAKLLELYRAQADHTGSDERRAKLLSERARLFRDVLGRASDGIATYREILEIDPDNLSAIEGLQALLVEGEDWPALAEHLRTRIDRAADLAEQVALKNRLATLLETRLQDVGLALDLYEDVARQVPGDPEAISALERLAPDAEYTLRITRVLDPVYRQLDQWKKLVAVLEAQALLVDDDFERVRLLSEVGELHERRGGDPALALDAWARAFSFDPAAERARSEVDRLAGELRAWNQHVRAYEAALEHCDDPAVTSSLLMMLARVHDEKRGDLRAAMAVHERLATHDPGDPTPLDALEALHTMMGDWRGLGRTLERKIERAYDGQERGELQRRLGSVREELLSDHAAAIAAYAQAVSEDPSDALAYEALDRLHGLERDHEALAAVLERRIDLALLPKQRIELGLRQGAVLTELMHHDRAIASYARVLEDDPACGEALTALSTAYERHGMWRELLDNVDQRQRLASGPAAVSLQHRGGEILEQHLGEPGQAIERYSEALASDATHTSSLDALLRMAAHPEHGARAAELALPRLREQRRWDDVASLIEAGLERLSDPIARRMELQSLAEVHERERGNPDAAFAALTSALSEDPEDEALLSDLERLARERGSFSELAKVLGDQAQKTPDGSVAAELQRRLARIFEEELGDDERAIDALEQASHKDERVETMVALDRLYERTARWAPLVSVLERRVGSTAEPAIRVDLLIRLGELRDERLQDARGAFVAFKEILEDDPTEARALRGMEHLSRHEALAHDVLETLDRSYQQSGASHKLAELYEIRVRLADSDAERIALLRDAAHIWRDELHNPARALANLRRAFELDPGDSAAIGELEGLAEAGGFEGLRGMIEGLITSGAAVGQQKRALAEKGAEWYRTRLRDADSDASEERCLRWALEVDATQIELHERLTALLRSPGKEAALVVALREHADAEHDLERRKALLRDAAQIAGGPLQDARAAAACLEAVLDCDPEDREALSELARLFATLGDFGKVVLALERRLPLEPDPDLRQRLRLQVAETYETQLHDGDHAIAAYRAVLEETPDHEPAQRALERLYAQLKRWADLTVLLERRRDRASGELRAELRGQLAKLAEGQGDPERAIAEWIALLEEQPADTNAEPELQRLFASQRRWHEASALLERRAGRASAEGDTRAELDLLRQWAVIQESELETPAKAIEIYARMHAREPSDQPTLEALVKLQLAERRWADAAQSMGSLLALRSGSAAVELGLRLAEIADRELADPATAEAALLAAHKIDPAHPATRAKLIEFYERRGLDRQLASVLDAELTLTPEPAQKQALLKRIAALYRDRLSDPARAVGYLEQAVALAPNEREVLIALCDLYVAADRPGDAIPLLLKVIDSYGSRRAKEVAVYQHRLGQAYERLGDLDQALSRYDAAFRVDLTSVPILRDLGRLCLAKGELDRAQKTFRALLLQKLGPESGVSKADVYYRLGEISLKQGDALKAKAMLERAIAESGDHAEARAMLAKL